MSTFLSKLLGGSRVRTYGIFNYGGDETARPIYSPQEGNELLRLCPAAAGIIQRIAQGVAACVLRATDREENIIPLPALFQYPSPHVNFYELLSGTAKEVLRYGYAILYAPEGKELRILDGTNTQLKVREERQVGTDNYREILHGVTYLDAFLPAEDIILILDRACVSLDELTNGQPVLGRTQQAATLIRKYVEISQLEGANINGRGVQGVLYKKITDVNKLFDSGKTISEQRQQEERLENEFGLGKNKRRFAMASGEMGFIDMAKRMEDIIPYERTKNVVDEIAQCYGYPPDMVSTSGNKTFANYETAARTAYVEAIIPLANTIIRQIIMGLGLENLHIEADFSNVSELKEDKGEAVRIKKEYLTYYKMLMDLDVWNETEFKTAVLQLEKEV